MAPGEVTGVEFDPVQKRLRIAIDFQRGSRFAVGTVDGLHPVHDTVSKEYRHLNFFQHECVLPVRTPRVRLPDGSVRLVEIPFAGRLSGFTLLFEALVMRLGRAMNFSVVAAIVGISFHRVLAICPSSVDAALEQADYSEVTKVAIDETLRARGHHDVTLAADADQRRVLFVTEGKDAATIKAFADDFQRHGGDAQAIESVLVDRSPAFLKGVQEHLPNAQITFDKFHVSAHASAAIEKTREVAPVV